MRRQFEQARFHPMRVMELIKTDQIIIWGLPFAFCLHLLDEIFMNGGFVYGVQRLIWPSYNGLKFGLVNVAFFFLIFSSSYLYSIRPDKWKVLPLFWLWERTWNGLWHILWVLIWKEYSPGLVTSLLFGLILLWFLIRESSTGRLSWRMAASVATAGLIFEILFISTLFVLR